MRTCTIHKSRRGAMGTKKALPGIERNTSRVYPFFRKKHIHGATELYGERKCIFFENFHFFIVENAKGKLVSSVGGFSGGQGGSEKRMRSCINQ